MISKRRLLSIENPSQFEVVAEFQGRVFKAAVTRKFKEPSLEPYQGPKRGKVKGFSRKARKRLLDDANRISKHEFESMHFRPKFITLTYPKSFPSCRKSKDHLESFCRKLKRRFSRISGIWRLELQERGAPHYHLIVFGMPFVPFAWIRRWWEETIGFDPAAEGVDHVFVRIEEIESYKALTCYVAKYCAKMPENIGESGEAAALLDSEPYSGMDNDPGRWWGKINRKMIPWADLLLMRIPLGEWFYRVKRVSKKIYKNIKYYKNKLSGYTLYLNDLDKFESYVQNTFVECNV